MQWERGRVAGWVAPLALVLVGVAACSGAEDGASSGGGGAQGDGGLGGTITTGGPGGGGAVGAVCKAPADCGSGSCVSGKCAAPSPTDGVKNGDESDVDCGGAGAPKCASGKGCSDGPDCASGACSYAKKCVDAPSCVRHFGGDTCGSGETGAAGAKHESCCTTIAVADGPDGAFTIDKYPVTAGRMRAFIEKTKGDVRGFVTQAKPKGYDESWNDQLPSNMTEALASLGPWNKRGCDVKAQGGRTYAQDPIGGDAAEKSDFSQDVLDEKALNCVSWYMAAAFCAFDGRRLVTSDEMRHVFKNGGGDKYPWGGDDARTGVINHFYAYATPNPPATMRIVGTGDGAYPLDHAFYVSPPGRFPAGASKNGVQDAAGDVLPWVAGNPRDFLWTHSWEKHKGDTSVSNWGKEGSGVQDGYYAIGIRCAKD